MTVEFKLKELCKIKTPFKDKFGIPRQSGLVPEATGELVFPNDNFHRECVRGLEDFSHIWLSFIFHKVIVQGQKSLVRPPRLGGKEKVGVWATRSPHRPNHLGLTVCKMVSLDIDKNHIILRVEGVDLLDGTPIVDIKPYVPYADSVQASSAWVPEPESVFKPRIEWDENIKEALPKELAVLVEKILEQDPRPTAQKDEKESYVFHLDNYEVRFNNGKDSFLITSVLPQSYS